MLDYIIALMENNPLTIIKFKDSSHPFLLNKIYTKKN